MAKKLTKGNKQVSCYADGGKVKPTYVRSVMAKLGVGDGYGNPKNPKDVNRLSISNSPGKFSETMSKRKKALADT